MILIEFKKKLYLRKYMGNKVKPWYMKWENYCEFFLDGLESLENQTNKSK